MDLDTCETKDDLKLPEGELGETIKQAFEKDETGILVSVSLLLKQAFSVSVLSWHNSFFKKFFVRRTNLNEIKSDREFSLASFQSKLNVWS